MTSRDDAYLQEAADHAMIVDLVQRYAYYADYGPSEAFISLFAEDARLDYPPVGLSLRGSQMIKEFAEIILAADLGLHHVQSGFVIDVDGETATSNCEVNLFTQSPEFSGHVVQGRYSDTLARHHGRWLFTSRACTLSDTSLQTFAASPLAASIAPLLSGLIERAAKQS